MNQIELLIEEAEKATPGPWGITAAGQGSLEAAPGRSIFSSTNTEPVARVSGYLMPDGNATFIAAADPTTIIAWGKALLLADKALGGDDHDVDQDVLYMTGRADEPCTKCLVDHEALAAIAKIKGEE